MAEMHQMQPFGRFFFPLPFSRASGAAPSDGEKVAGTRYDWLVAEQRKRIPFSIEFSRSVAMAAAHNRRDDKGWKGASIASMD